MIKQLIMSGWKNTFETYKRTSFNTTKMSNNQESIKENTNDSPANYKSLGVPWNAKTMISRN